MHGRKSPEEINLLRGILENNFVQIQEILEHSHNGVLRPLYELAHLRAEWQRWIKEIAQGYARSARCARFHPRLDGRGFGYHRNFRYGQGFAGLAVNVSAAVARRLRPDGRIYQRLF